jgi:hypothetical protein
MTTDIDSLTPGNNGHGLRLGIGRKGLLKTGKNPWTHLSKVDCLAFAISKSSYYLAQFL